MSKETLSKKVLTFLLIALPSVLFAQGAFITRWDLAGTTTLSFGTATSGTVSYTWQEELPGTASGSGTFSGNTLTITGLPSTKILLSIFPTNFQQIKIGNAGDKDRLLNIKQWGTAAWTSMQSAFFGCTNLNITATDIPDLASVSDMSWMFWNCSNLSTVPNINSWNTSAVTNMSSAFRGCSKFNENIRNWNTANVVSMIRMFMNSSFNQNIGSWNTAKVGSMISMFEGAAFNQNISGWNTALVTDMTNMFRFATPFNQNLGNWSLNANVNLSNMLDNSGMDCSNYAATLVGWQANASCPTGRTLGAAGKTYDPTATAARNNLVLASGSGGKGWTITGDAFSSSCGALPVTWLDFTGQFAKNNVILNWKTASEQNNTGFDVERSADGRYWSKIGFIPGKINSAVPTPYSYTDLSPLKGLSYYRLKQIDLDNKFSYSRTVQINGLTTDEASVWPNPVTNMLNIGINERYRNEKVYLTVTDMKGTVLVSRTVTNGNLAISTAAWSKALYVVTLRSGGNIIMTKKIIRQ